MSTRPTKKAAQPLAVETVSRRPQQGRSKASLERMLEAAKGLMLELGSEDFTLLEVSKRGNVSIGCHIRAVLPNRLNPNPREKFLLNVLFRTNGFLS